MCGAELLRGSEKGVELDLAVAENVRIRRASLFVFAEHIIHHPLAVLLAQVHEIEGYAYLSRHQFSHEPVLFPLAVSVQRAFRVVPILHKHREHVIALLL